MMPAATATVANGEIYDGKTLMYGCWMNRLT